MQVRRLGLVPYADTDDAMRAFNAARTDTTDDELWLVEHPPVYTQGIAGRDSHVLAPGSIPVVRTDRGGQVTYHGPGQVVAYPLVDLKRVPPRGIFVKEYVFRLEQAVLDVLESYGVTGHRVGGAPGIYVRRDDPFGHARLDKRDAAADPGAFAGLAKIAALGIKVSGHRTRHGLALNVGMDLEPFSRIDPCGYAGLMTTDLRALGIETSWDEAATRLAQALVRRLG